MNYFATPVSSFEAFNNYKKTVLQGIDISHFEKYNLPELKLMPATDHLIHLWGVKGDKKSRWNKVNKGDILFFYYNKYVISYCKILNKFENSEIAENLWGSFQNRYYSKFTWPLIMVLDKPKECRIPFTKFNKIIGYSENYFLRSFFKLSDAFSNYIENNFSGIEDFARKESEDRQSE